jgi:hypothetical protein
MSNAKYLITFAGSRYAGDYMLTNPYLGGATAGPINWDRPATGSAGDDIISYLSALANVGAGNVLVVDLSSTQVSVEYTSALANTNVPALSIDTANLKQSAGDPTIVLSPAGNAGTYTLDLGSATINSFSLNGTAITVNDGTSQPQNSDIQSACDGIWGTGKVAVASASGYPGPWTLTWLDLGPWSSAPAITANGTDGSPRATSNGDGVAAVVTITLPTGTDFGTFTLTNGSYVTTNMPWNDDPAGNFTDEMNAMWGGGIVSVSGTAGVQYVVTWNSAGYRGPSPIQLSGETLGKPLSASVSTLQTGAPISIPTIGSKRIRRPMMSDK